MSSTMEIGHAFHSSPPPDWALRARKNFLQHSWDFLGAPLRMALLPDFQSEKLGLTSLRAERLRMVLPELEGRVLDIGCGDNMLLRLYTRQTDDSRKLASVGADVVRWSDDVHLITSSAQLDFPSESFDTISYVACLNHIPERAEALKEANRLLRPGGKVVVTMIGSVVGKIGHAIWWYSEDKRRELHPDELMGIDPPGIIKLFSEAKLTLLAQRRFVYGLNNLFVAVKRAA